MRKILLAALALLCLPATGAMAAGLHLYGTYWNSDSLDSAAGAGVQLAIPLGERVNFDLGGTYYQPFDGDALRDQIDDALGGPNSNADVFPGDISVIPLDVGFSVNLNRGGSVNPTLGGGGTYFLMDSDHGSIDDEVGWYADVGLEFAPENKVGWFLQAMYRAASGTYNNHTESIDTGNVKFDLDGPAFNGGVVFRW